MALLGYAEAQSVAAGAPIAFYVSATAELYRADIVRLHCPDVGPGGPPFDERVMDCALNGQYPGRRQELHPGSYVRADLQVDMPPAFWFRLGVHPTRLGAAGRQSILDLHAPDHQVLLYIEDSKLHLELPDHGLIVTAEPSLIAGAWIGVVAAVDVAAGAACLYARARGSWGLELDWSADAVVVGFAPRAPGAEVGAAAPSLAPAPRGFGVMLGCESRRNDAFSSAATRNHFNGKVERLTLFTDPLDAAGIERVARRGPNEEVGSALLDWDFGLGITDTEHVEDCSGNEVSGTAIHLPARAVKSSNWDGLQIDWRAAPDQYAAVHFHDDDMSDAAWEATQVLEVPVDWPSACYALRLVDGEHEWRVPFFVRPRCREDRQKVAYLIPTATYAAYANMNLRVRAPFNEMNQGRLIVLDATDLLMLQMPELGKSTYDNHSDGSAVIYSSMRRPVTNFRPKGRIYKFCEDLLLVDWLEYEGVRFDVLTDEDLHREGVAALDGYAVTIVATHPEYYSRAMLDALESYLTSGGRVMLLGGNVYWWDSEFHPTRSGTVEVRRPGVQTLWTVDYSESVYNFVPAPGGELRKVGRRPASLAGSTYVTMGFDECRPYRRLALADDRAAFVFEGIDDDLIGDFGLLAEGAAGYEIDRASAANGTPRHAVRLASSFDHSNNFDNALESWADKVPPADDDDPQPIRADMVFFAMPSGGAVFSVGSIAWAGSLSHNGYENNVRRVAANVLKRFLDPEPFEFA